MDYILIFFSGVLIGGWFSSYFIKMMKKNGYLNFEVTEKFHKEIKK